MTDQTVNIPPSTYIAYQHQTSSKHPQEVFQRCVQDVFRRYYHSNETVLVKKPSRRTKHVSKTYCRDWYLQKDKSDNFMFKSDKNFSIFSFSLYYTI